MDDKKTESVGFLDGISSMIKSGIERRREDSSAVLFDAMIILISFLFSRCHIVFSAYPLGIAFVAFLPRGVWLALVGGVIGSLSLGGIGVIQAIITIVVVFMRIIISGGEKNSERGLFSEPLILRISAAAIGAFVGAAYEALLGGFALAAMLHGGFSVILAAGFTFVFSGILDAKISFSDFVFGKRNIFVGRVKDKEKTSLYLFQATFLIFVFLISLSLKSYNVLGISPAYIFSAAITLIISRRFGAIRALGVGFVSSLGVSGLYSVAFALVGLASGLLFSAGITYAFVGGGVLLSLWCAYTGGALGFLSTFPEYVTATLLTAPLIRKMSGEISDAKEIREERNDAADMVAATALAYKHSRGSSLDGLEEALVAMSRTLRSLGDGDGVINQAEYRDAALDSMRGFCRECSFYADCTAEHPAPCIENLDSIASKLCRKERLFPDDAVIAPKYCRNAGGLFDCISRSAAALEEERIKGRKLDAIAEDYELFSRLLSEARRNDERERSQNAALSEKLSEVLSRSGLYGGAVKAFGERRKYFILAGEDKDGSLVTSPELHRAIEEEAGVRLGVPEYYRKGDTALLECPSVPMFTVEFAAVGKKSEREAASGDTAISFESVDGHFYSLIADGMGSGDAAHRTSQFAADLLSRLLEHSPSKTTAFHILNHAIKNRSEECSSSVDLFDFDLFTGDAVFFKCGAAPSYVKRENSIFRIRSETAPIGIMKTIDAERIRVEVKPGDYIVMLSDGVSQSPEDSAWLLELLAKEPPADIREYAEAILGAAVKNSSSVDDMSIAVARVVAA